MSTQTITFKLLTKDDLALLHDWFQKPLIQQWYAKGKTFTLEMIKEKYLPRIFNPDSLSVLVISE